MSELSQISPQRHKHYMYGCQMGFRCLQEVHLLESCPSHQGEAAHVLLQPEAQRDGVLHTAHLPILSGKKIRRAAMPRPGWGTLATAIASISWVLGILSAVRHAESSFTIRMVSDLCPTNVRWEHLLTCSHKGLQLRKLGIGLLVQVHQLQDIG